MSSTKEAIFLKELFEFYIVPMVNIDGVHIGNFRCDLNGHDMNRRWKKIDKVNLS